MENQTKSKPSVSFGHIFDKILNFFTYFTACLIFLAFLMVVFSVISRYTFKTPQNWVTEVTQYILVGITYLAAAAVLKNEQHVVIDLVLGLINPKSRTRWQAINSILGAIICLVCAIMGTFYVIDAFKTNVHMYSPMAPLRYPLYAMIPLGFLLLFIQFLRRTNKYFRLMKQPMNGRQDVRI